MKQMIVKLFGIHRFCNFHINCFAASELSFCAPGCKKHSGYNSGLVYIPLGSKGKKLNWGKESSWYKREEYGNENRNDNNKK